MCRASPDPFVGLPLVDRRTHPVLLLTTVHRSTSCLLGMLGRYGYLHSALRWLNHGHDILQRAEQQVPRVRDVDVERIVEILRENQDHAVADEPPSVLPLVGRYGFSEASVAKKVFDHPWVASTYDFRCWIDWPPGRDFSEPYDLPAQLVEWLTEEECVLQDRDAIARAAKELLSPSTYLVVVDNSGGGDRFFPRDDNDWVPHESHDETDEYFTQLMDVLRAGRAGSTVITIGCYFAGVLDQYVLPPLSPHESRQLFASNINMFLSMEANPPAHFPVPPALVDIAKKIIQRCKGRTFLIVHFHEVLSREQLTTDAWRNVLDNFDDHCPERDEWITTRFHSLQPQLKKCLLHCAPFPRGYIFNIQELIDVWVAEDPVARLSVRGELHGVYNAFNEMLDEWFYPHPRSSSNQKLYMMRPHRHAVLEKINTGWPQGRRRHGAKITPEACWIAREVEQVCLLVDSEACKFPKPLFRLRNLKKLIIVPDEDMLLSADQQCDIKEVLPELCYCTSLVVLDLRATRIKELPPEFRYMIRLRYLNLSRTDIESVPGSIRALHVLKYLNLSHTNILVVPDFLGRIASLEVLDLSHCEKLVEFYNDLSNLVLLERLNLQGCYYLSGLPEGMGNMANLVYLNTLECSSLTRMPPGMDRLAKLQELSGYVIGEPHENAISDLKPLVKLKVLALDCLENVLQVQQAKDANLNAKHGLVSLSLRWNMDAENADQVLASLQPNEALQNLEIVSFPGNKFPWWMTQRETYLKSLLHIKLFNLKSCQRLPPLGQLPLLETAEINKMNAISVIDHTFYGADGTFPSLEKLILSHMRNLEIWHHSQRKNMFPRLCELTVIHCPRFAALCMELKHVRKLSFLMNNRLLYSTRGGIQGVARSVRIVSISLCQELTSFDGCKALLELGHIEELEVCSCPELTTLPYGIRYLVSLRSLRVENCTRLESLPNWLQSFRSLRLLSISDCPALRSIPDGLRRPSDIEVSIEGCPNCSS